MSQFTRCPFCETTFKVVVDQLRVSQGWVRCGHCKQLFDASRHLHGTQSQEEPLPSQLPQETDTPAPPARMVPRAPAAEVSRPKVAPPAPLEVPIPVPHHPPAPAVPTVAEPPETVPAPSPDLTEEIAARKRHRKSSHASHAAPREAASKERRARKKRREPVPAPPDSIMSDYDSDLEFVRAARRNAFWRRPVVRAAVGFLVLLLTGTLLLQIALQERDALAARYPATQAGLARLCASLGCTLQAPRRIDAVVIDSSTFLKARGDDNTYQLQMSLKNTAPTAIAMPALELTLTDAQDQVTLRRVLLPSDLAAPEHLEGNGSWGAKVAVRVAAPAAHVAGYRVEAFYP